MTKPQQTLLLRLQLLLLLYTQRTNYITLTLLTYNYDYTLHSILHVLMNSKTELSDILLQIFSTHYKTIRFVLYIPSTLHTTKTIELETFFSVLLHHYRPITAILHSLFRNSILPYPFTMNRQHKNELRKQLIQARMDGNLTELDTAFHSLIKQSSIDWYVLSYYYHL